jgi:hypothetical protein
MKPKNLLQVWPTQAEIARALQITEASVSAWFKNDEVPLMRQFQVEKLTKGKLRAHVPSRL